MKGSEFKIDHYKEIIKGLQDKNIELVKDREYFLKQCELYKNHAENFCFELCLFSCMKDIIFYLSKTKNRNQWHSVEQIQGNISSWNPEEVKKCLSVVDYHVFPIEKAVDRNDENKFLYRYFKRF
jgi:hypothetical protein